MQNIIITIKNKDMNRSTIRLESKLNPQLFRTFFFKNILEKSER